jgi:hypothetical protein
MYLAADVPGVHNLFALLNFSALINPSTTAF